MKKIVVFILILIFITVGIGFYTKVIEIEILENKNIIGYVLNEEKEEELEIKKLINPTIIEQKAKHIKTPEVVKSLYFTANGINYKPKKDNLLDLIDNTEINSVTIDVKTVSGYINFDISEFGFTKIETKSNKLIKNIKELIEELHKKDVYIIARIVVFKDNLLAETRPDLAIKGKDKKTIWEDYKENKYVDPYSKDVWDYNIDIASAAYKLGFDEINFDYVRFPSDGPVKNIYFPFSKDVNLENANFNKIAVIDKFATYTTEKLKSIHPEIVLSADVFGLVTKNDIYSIGQNLESFVMNFDFVGPMVYPSHYGAGYLGFVNPDNHPYEILNEAFTFTNAKIDKLNKDIAQATASGTSLVINNGFTPEKKLENIKEIKKTSIRPWIQGFSCSRCKNYIPYNRTKFRKQISSIVDNGLNSFWVWSSGNNYYKNRYEKK